MNELCQKLTMLILGNWTIFQLYLVYRERISCNVKVPDSPLLFRIALWSHFPKLQLHNLRVFLGLHFDRT